MKAFPGEWRDSAEPIQARAALDRSEIADRYKWDLGRVFPDWRAWEKDFEEVEGALAGLASLQGSLGRSAGDLLGSVTTLLAVQRKLEVIQVFANMKSDEDTRIGENTARRGKALSLGVRFAEATSWFEAELLELEPSTLKRFSDEEPGLRLYDHFFDDIQRSRQHTLGPDQEAILAAVGNLARGPRQVFGALNNADLKFPTIVDEEGREVEITKARYSKFLKSTDRRVRRDAFATFQDTYGAAINTLAANMDANVMSHVFFARTRRFSGSLEAALHPNAISPDVFHTLLKTTEANLPVAHRYTALKKRVLGLDPLCEFDLSLPLLPEAEFKFGYEEAQKLLVEALDPLGPDYLQAVQEGYDQRWIDVHENTGKRSGAYSGGAYDTSPYILLNWSDQLRDTFTLAHEMGHSVHTFMATGNQPYVYGDYPIFTAEVASTCNEMLLIHHLLDSTEDADRKLYLLDFFLAQIYDTVIRQVMFADFEYRIHRLAEQGETLTADLLGDTYQDLLDKFWGPEVQFDPKRSRLSWCRIPHFYLNFYVYQYATAYAAATTLSSKILAGDGRARESYLGFLRSGNSRYPVETLQVAGVDMRGPQPIQDVFTLFGSLLDRVDGLLKQKGR